MQEIGQMQMLFAFLVMMAIGCFMFSLYSLRKQSVCEEFSPIGIWVLGLSFLFFVFAILTNVTTKLMETRIHEIEKIESALQTGALYYNNDKIATDNMTPEQIYSDFSYTIAEDGVYVYTK